VTARIAIHASSPIILNLLIGCPSMLHWSGRPVWRPPRTMRLSVFDAANRSHLVSSWGGGAAHVPSLYRCRLSFFLMGMHWTRINVAQRCH
jgi:hypothetical protein